MMSQSFSVMWDLSRQNVKKPLTSFVERTAGDWKVLPSWSQKFLHTGACNFFADIKGDFPQCAPGCSSDSDCDVMSGLGVCQNCQCTRNICPVTTNDKRSKLLIVNTPGNLNNKATKKCDTGYKMQDSYLECKFIAFLTLLTYDLFSKST